MKTIPSIRPMLAGVIGNPISHSKSPKLHNYWLRKYNVNGYYIPIQVEPKNLSKTVDSLKLLGFRGVNVTIPHKTAILSIAHTITDRAAIIGAANTLYFNPDGKITADNTDGYGFKQNICSKVPSWDPNNGPVVVIGAGGAAKAVIHTLLSEGASTVKLLNRTKSKAEALAETLGNKVEVIDWYAIDEALQGARTVVNATSLGMIGQPKLNVNLQNVVAPALITDLVYNPLNTDMLKQANELGHNTVDGLGMLLYQAELGFTNWFNCKPEINIDLREFMMGSDNSSVQKTN